MSDKPLQRVILNYPTALRLAESKNGAVRSWNQFATTGVFHSKRYGKFSITKDDLAEMVKNFREVTPKAPTELPVDWDHLSMDPKKPGDGAAAGWVKNLELREDGNELWAEVEWTEPAAEQIRKKHYRFISPSFVKSHEHSNGEQIGTTLLAAAITNHPFLQGMQAVTLYSFSALGELALAEGQTSAVNLAEIGQRVTFNPNDEETVPELTPEQRSKVYEVKGVKRDAVFVKIATLDGERYGWYPEEAFAPAAAPLKSENSPMPKEEIQMSDTIKLAAEFVADVRRHEAAGKTADEAFKLAARENVQRADAYRAFGVGSEVQPETESESYFTVREDRRKDIR